MSRPETGTGLACSLFVDGEWFCDLPLEAAAHLQIGDVATVPNWRTKRPADEIERADVEIVSKRWCFARRHDSDPILELEANRLTGLRRCDHDWQPVDPAAPRQRRCVKCHARGVA